MQALLYPLDKAVIGDKNICLGMDKSSVFNMLGKGESFDEKRYYYFNSDLAVDFDDKNKVEFIEFLGGIDGELQPMIYNISAFEENADDLLEILKKFNNGEIDDSENGYSYGFLEISVGIYREFLPEEVIEDAKNNNMSLDDEDVMEDLRKALHWATIGFGVKNYYR
ncbi:MAG: hypothetical protein K2K57_04320 [Oscillospiraceae bacterium]|nr:hypothetical protein [Oscillospiraceae bacterium]